MSDDASQGQASGEGAGSQSGQGGAGVKVDVSKLAELKKLADATTHEAVAGWLGITPPTED